MTTFYEKLSLENYFGPNHHHRYNHHRILNEAAAGATTTGSSSLSTSSSASSSSTAAATAIVIDKAVHNLPFELTTTAGGSLTKFNYVPAIVPIPTIRADDRELAFKVHLEFHFLTLDKIPSPLKRVPKYQEVLFKSPNSD